MTIEKKLREEGRKEGKKETYDVLMEVSTKFEELNPTTIEKIKELDKQSKLDAVEKALYDSKSLVEFKNKIDSI